MIETLQDSYKDMDNNIEALNYGLLHPNDNCRNWLKDFDYKNVTDYKDITIKQVPMLIHVENKKIDHVYYKASDIKKALE